MVIGLDGELERTGISACRAAEMSSCDILVIK